MIKFDEQKQIDSVNGALALRGQIELVCLLRHLRDTLDIEFICGDDIYPYVKTFYEFIKIIRGCAKHHIMKIFK